MKIIPNHLNFTGKKYTCIGIPNKTRVFYIVGLDKYIDNRWHYKIEIRDFDHPTEYYIIKENVEYNFRTKYFVEVKG